MKLAVRLFLLVWLAAASRAHTVGISMVQGRLSGATLELVAGFAPADAQQLLPLGERTEGKFSPTEFVATKVRFDAIGSQLWEVQVDGTPVAPVEVQVELLPGDNLSFRLVFPHPASAKIMTLRAAKLAMLPAGHRQFVIISDNAGFTRTKRLLNAQDDRLDVPLTAVAPMAATVPAGAEGAATVPAESAGAPTFWAFLKLGIEHIWTGYDHLLFLFALLIVCRSFRSIALIITFFTLAHSTTLALATLDVVNLPSRITEPAIAASIVFVGVENLLRRGAEPRGRWALTFAFGLIHGFGFASVLRELGVGQHGTSMVMPLFTFNAGVEVGQITIAAIVLPVVWRLRKNERFLARGVPALSAIVSLAGLYWFLERTVFA